MGTGKAARAQARAHACGMWHVACGLWHVACGMWHVGCALLSHVACGMRPMACGVWHAACGMWGCALPRHSACNALLGIPHALRTAWGWRGGKIARGFHVREGWRSPGVTESVAHSRRRTHRCALTVALWHTHVWASGALEARWLCGHAYCGVIIICMIYRVSILRRQIIFWIA